LDIAAGLVELGGGFGAELVDLRIGLAGLGLDVLAERVERGLGVLEGQLAILLELLGLAGDLLLDGG
jgi:hypothetical protein